MYVIHWIWRAANSEIAIITFKSTKRTAVAHSEDPLCLSLQSEESLCLGNCSKNQQMSSWWYLLRSLLQSPRLYNHRRRKFHCSQQCSPLPIFRICGCFKSSPSQSPSPPSSPSQSTSPSPGEVSLCLWGVSPTHFQFQNLWSKMWETPRRHSEITPITITIITTIVIITIIGNICRAEVAAVLSCVAV